MRAVLGVFATDRCYTFAGGEDFLFFPNERPKAIEIPAQTKSAIWGAVGGAILTLVLGFYLGGWHHRMAEEVSDKKVIAALAPFCVDQFLKSADPAQTDALLKLTTNYERGSFLEKCGWTGLPGSNVTNWGVGRACGDLLAVAAKK